jgi:GxxExxY protein
MLVHSSPLFRRVLGCAIEVHRALGPGLLESAYRQCLASELAAAGIQFAIEMPVPVVYRGVRLECGYRADFVVEGLLLLELKSVERLLPVHTAQVMTYLRLLDLKQAILVNFNVTRLVDGVRSVLM